MRALTHKDIATGEVDLNEYAAANGKQYSTKGPSDTWHMRNDMLPAPKHICYTLDVPSRCTAEEAGWIKDGSAIIKDYILIGHNNDSSSNAEDEGLNDDRSRPNEAQIPLLGKDW